MPGLTPTVSHLRVRIRAQAIKNPPLFPFYEKGMEGDFYCFHVFPGILSPEPYALIILPSSTYPSDR